MLTPQAPPSTSVLVSPTAHWPNPCRPHHDPGPGLGHSQAPPTSPSHYFVSRLPLSVCPLSLGSSHGPLLGLGPAFRLLPHLLGLFPGSAHSPSPSPVTLGPAPGSSHSPVSSQAPPTALVGSWAALSASVPPSSATCKSVPSAGLGPARPTDLELPFWRAGRLAVRSQGPDASCVPFWVPRRGRWRRRGPEARGESATANRRAWRRRPRESAAQTEAARRGLQAKGRGRRTGSSAAGGRSGPAAPP